MRRVRRELRPLAKAWLVSSGSYSDYGVHAVFTNKEKAEAYMSVIARMDGCWYEVFVEERELDPEVPATMRLYQVVVGPDGNEVSRREREEFLDSPFYKSRAEYDWVSRGGEVSLRLSGAVGVSDRDFDVALKAARDELHRAKAHMARFCGRRRGGELGSIRGLG